MFFFDPLYLLFMIPGLALSLWASFKTKRTFNKYAQIQSSSGYTGARAAQIMLERQGITGVTIKPVAGDLTDHYNPADKSLALSERVYSGTSLSAIGVACHEAGHAIQHASSYAFLNFRSAVVPLVGISSNFSYFILIAGMFMASKSLILAGAVLFAVVTLFTIITLPVEWDASARAKKAMISANLLSPTEQVGASRVLNAAFMTYLAAAVSSILTLVYFLLRAGVFGNDD